MTYQKEIVEMDGDARQKRSKSLNIAVLSIHSSPIGPLGTKNTGGMSIYVREVARWMGAWGHQVDIFTYTPGSPDPIELYPNVKLIHLNTGSAGDIPKEKLFHHLPVVADALKRYARDNSISYHVLHSHYWLSGLVGHMVQSQLDCPHLTMFHTLGRIKNATTAEESEPEQRISNERRLVDVVDGLVVPTQMERNNLLKHYGAAPEKISVVPCGVNMERFRPLQKGSARLDLNLDDKSELMLFVGRFAPVKGMGILLEALKILLPRYPQLKLIVIGGDGPDADTTRAFMDQADALQIRNRILVAGRVPHPELHRYYNAADLVVLPSFYESFGLVTLESLACGTPVVATNTGGAASIIRDGDNGMLVDQPNPVTVSRAIERLLNQVRRQPYAKEQVRGSVAAYGWDRISASILKIYHPLLY